MHSILTQAADYLRRTKSNVEFELYATERQGVDIEAKDGKVDTLENSEDRALSIRVFDQGRAGFAFTTDLDPASIQACCRSALEIAELMDRDENTALPALEKAEPSPKELPPARASEAQKIQAALELEALTRAADPRISGIRSAGLSESRWSKILLRSDGVTRSDRGGMYSASVYCKASADPNSGPDGDHQMGGAFRFAPAFEALDLRKTAQLAAERAVLTLGSKPVTTRTCPAILRNDVVAELVSFLVASFSAEELDKGRSLLLGKRGQRVFSPQLTLRDDALLPGGYASRAMDGEGVVSRPLTLIREGVFESVLYDSRFAHKEKTRSTGHAGRDFRSVPTISPTNLVLTPGTDSFEALIRKMGSGIVLIDLMGMHTANPVTGDFSVGAEGLVIENGEIQSSFRGAAVSGKVLDLLSQVVAVGSDTDAFGAVHAPSLWVEKISLGGTA